MATTFFKKQCRESTDRYTCPVCDNEVKNVCYSCYENRKEFKVLRCITCGFMFVRPLFLPTLEERKLDYEYDTELLNSASLRRAHERFIIGKEIKHVRNILGKGVLSLLDIGCGTGWTTNIWSSSGFETTGLEPSELRARLASERYRMKVFSDFFENLEINYKFDVVILRHMIEHFANPYEMTKKAHSLLKPDGIAVIIVPNINCLGRYLFGTKWTWGIPYHCNFFDPGTLSMLAERAGFEIMIAYQTPSPLLYPESLRRFFPLQRSAIAKKHATRLLSLISCVPFVLLGYILNMSENITLIAQARHT